MKFVQLCTVRNDFCVGKMFKNQNQMQTTLYKTISVQGYDVNPTVICEKSRAVISCKEIHSVHILPYRSG